VPGEAAEGVVAAAVAEREADGHEQAAHGGERPPAEAGLASRLRERLLPPADAERTCLLLRSYTAVCRTNDTLLNVSGGTSDDRHELRVGRHQRPAERGGGGGAAAGSAARREPCWVCVSFLAPHHHHASEFLPSCVSWTCMWAIRCFAD
jgi:hypothetical protein